MKHVHQPIIKSIEIKRGVQTAFCALCGQKIERRKNETEWSTHQ